MVAATISMFGLLLLVIPRALLSALSLPSIELPIIGPVRWVDPPLWAAGVYAILAPFVPFHRRHLDAAADQIAAGLLGVALTFFSVLVEAGRAASQIARLLLLAFAFVIPSAALLYHVHLRHQVRAEAVATVRQSIRDYASYGTIHGPDPSHMSATTPADTVLLYARTGPDFVASHRMLSAILHFSEDPSASRSRQKLTELYDGLVDSSVRKLSCQSLRGANLADRLFLLALSARIWSYLANNRPASEPALNASAAYDTIRRNCVRVEDSRSRGILHSLATNGLGTCEMMKVRATLLGHSKHDVLKCLDQAARYYQQGQRSGGILYDSSAYAARRWRNNYADLQLHLLYAMMHHKGMPSVASYPMALADAANDIGTAVAVKQWAFRQLTGLDAEARALRHPVQFLTKAQISSVAAEYLGSKPGGLQTAYATGLLESGFDDLSTALALGGLSPEIGTSPAAYFLTPYLESAELAPRILRLSTRYGLQWTPKKTTRRRR